MRIQVTRKRYNGSACVVVLGAITFYLIILHEMQQLTSQPKNSNQQIRLSNKIIHTTTTNNNNNKTSKDESSSSSSCVSSMLLNKEAILANSTLADKSLSFQILLHPLSKDKYITPKILERGTYEPDMEQFIARALPLSNTNTFTNDTSTSLPWAVDMGTNIGFHSMHMAMRGANVISFEPAPDTAKLIQCTATELLKKKEQTSPLGRNIGTIQVIEAGVTDVESAGKLRRHPDSPGMTTFGGFNTSFPFDELNHSFPNNVTSSTATTNNNKNNTGMIPLLRADNVLIKHGIPEGRSNALRILKVDVEGFELRAFRGLDLSRFPFQYLTFEFFPAMIQAAGDNPLDLLILIRDSGYKCDYEKKLQKSSQNLKTWISEIKDHVNIFCQLYD